MALNVNELTKHDQMDDIAEQICDQYLSYDDVWSVFIGEKVKESGPTGEPAICFSVKKKGQYKQEQKIPSSIGGFPTDVVEDGPEPIRERDDQNRYRPVIGGAQVIGEGTDGLDHFGTAGMVVNIGHGSYILTAGHILRNFVNRQTVVEQYDQTDPVGLSWNWCDTNQRLTINGVNVRKFVDAGVISINRDVPKTEYALVTQRGAAGHQTSAVIAGAYNITANLIGKTCRINGAVTAATITATIMSVSAYYGPGNTNRKSKLIRIQSAPLVPQIAQDGDSGVVAYMGTLGVNARAIGLLSASGGRTAWLSAIDAIDIWYTLDLDFINCP